MQLHMHFSWSTILFYVPDKLLGIGVGRLFRAVAVIESSSKH